jgi:hypothetical protein
MKLQALIRLKVISQQATSKDPVGPTLGQFGIPIMDFCNKFNQLTERFFNGIPLNVLIFFYGHQKYDFLIQFPDLNYFIKLCYSENLMIRKPGYFFYDFFFYVTPYLLYEILSYYFLMNSKNNELMYSFYKKFFHSMKSNGLFVCK